MYDALQLLFVLGSITERLGTKLFKESITDVYYDDLKGDAPEYNDDSIYTTFYILDALVRKQNSVEHKRKS